MKKLLIALLLILVACEHKPDEKDILISDLKQDIASRLKNMYQTVAECDVLAKCLGGTAGKIDIKIPEYTFQYSYACIIYRPKESAVAHQTVDLEAIGPMLQGCQQRKCENNCKTN